MKKTKLATAVISAFVILSFTACDILFGGGNATTGSGGSGGSSNVTVDTDDPISGSLTGDTVTWFEKMLKITQLHIT